MSAPYTYIPCPSCGGRMDIRSRSQLCHNCWLTKRPDTNVPRLLALTDKSDSDGCWPWKGKATHAFGYGKFRLNRPRRIMDAHRAAWLLLVGPIPNGLQVCHRCDNPQCVRLDHLFLGTQADNMADMMAKGRGARGRRHGSHTHPERFRGMPENFIGHKGRKVARLA